MSPSFTTPQHGVRAWFVSTKFPLSSATTLEFCRDKQSVVYVNTVETYMDEESKLKIEQEEKSEHEGTFETLIEEETTLEVKYEENSEHEGTFENEEDEMEKREVTIPVFDGEEYSMRKKRITIYLKLKKCDVVITRARVAVDKEDWEEKDLKAINLIYSAISNKQLEFVCEEDTAYKIIKKLDDMYLKKCTALQIVCRNKLEN